MKKICRKYSSLYIAIINFIFIFPHHCKAQIELSTGIDMSYPFLLNSNNSKLNYGQITFGLRGGIAYKPENTQFFPILNVSYGRTRLPLKQFGDDVACLNFNYLNVMLNENYIVRFPYSMLYIYGGVGFSYLQRQNNEIAGPNGGAMQLTIDSSANTTKVFPAMNLGFEYVYGESTDVPIYLSLGINFQYILLLAQSNSYDITVGEPNYVVNSYKTGLTGNVISPGFYIALHYMLKRR